MIKSTAFFIGLIFLGCALLETPLFITNLVLFVQTEYNRTAICQVRSKLSLTCRFLCWLVTSRRHLGNFKHRSIDMEVQSSSDNSIILDSQNL
ncbi:hypothetical protein DIE14_15775 [Burkholderia sp. Bp9017]|nr:hypothetical protein DIE14_15775 [Burkholderia sp. Bp9017]RQZ33996.1 hypothetical protein DIE13_15685 [Burkholderia sp. Bp9016]